MEAESARRARSPPVEGRRRSRKGRAPRWRLTPCSARPATRGSPEAETPWFFRLRSVGKSPRHPRAAPTRESPQGRTAGPLADLSAHPELLGPRFRSVPAQCAEHFPLALPRVRRGQRCADRRWAWPVQDAPRPRETGSKVGLSVWMDPFSRLLPAGEGDAAGRLGAVQDQRAAEYLRPVLYPAGPGPRCRDPPPAPQALAARARVAGSGVGPESVPGLPRSTPARCPASAGPR